MLDPRIYRTGLVPVVLAVIVLLLFLGEARITAISASSIPLTMAIFGIVVGYYIAYYSAVIREMNKEAAAPLPPVQSEPQPPATN